MKKSFNISTADIEQGKVMAGLSYFTFIGFFIAILTNRENRYVAYHAQQSLALILLSLVRFIPFTPAFFDGIVSLIVFIFFIIGIVNGFSGKVQPLPLIGEMAYSIGLCKEDQTVE